MNVLLAAFYTPGIRAIEYLIQKGFQPQQLRLLTHDVDCNEALLEFVAVDTIDTKVFLSRLTAAYGWMKDFDSDAIVYHYFGDVYPVSKEKIKYVPALRIGSQVVFSVSQLYLDHRSLRLL